jgi:phosphoglycerate dehydrogenase-like enzyme
MKAVLQFRAGNALRQQLAAAMPAWLTTHIVHERDSAGFTAEMADSEMLLHVLEPVTDAFMAAAPLLRLIQKIGVGVNTIDLAAAWRRRIRVADMPGTNSQAVAEHTLALMLAALRRVIELHKATAAGTTMALPGDFFVVAIENCRRLRNGEALLHEV